MPGATGGWRSVDNYRLLGRIGEGGMGEVWEAEQTRPVRRRVALKLIRPGMDSAQVLARFESERQALALMDHPAIARVFDAGTTGRGHPYFAMELVKGVAITRFSDQHRLTLRQRLELFRLVCEGVQHAHQKAVIHRDLKPSNILVVEVDGRPLPKIIDFGLAKATAQSLTARTLHTQSGQLIGTPEYMSPEQAELTPEDVDVRTDVYSLGMVLYRLVAGVLPFDSEELRAGGILELQRRIREDEPSRPSTRVARLGAESSEVAEQQRTTVPALVKRLSGDLDWIVMKCLEKDRNRRYGSAMEIADDVRRFLDNQPIEARPPSVAYRAAKFVRRHRIGVAVATLVVTLLAVFAVASAIQARRVARERDRASREAETANRLLDYVVGLFVGARSGAGEGDPLPASLATAWGEQVTAREILERGAATLSERFADQPVVRARLQQTLATVYSELGLVDSAEPLMRQALDSRRSILGDRHPDVAESLHDLATLLADGAASEEAEALFLEALAIREEVLGPDHPGVAETLNNLADLRSSQGRAEEAESLYRRGLEIRRAALGDEHLSVAASLTSLGGLYVQQARFDEAEALLRRASEIQEAAVGPDGVEVGHSLWSLAILYSKTGRLAEADPLFRRALETRERAFGPRHPRVAQVLDSHAVNLAEQGRKADAELLFRRALSIQEEVLGPDHKDLAQSVMNLGLCIKQQGRYAEAEALYRRALALHERAFGPGSFQVGITLHNLAELQRAQDHLGEAESTYRRSQAILEASFEPGHPVLAHNLLGLANLYRDRGRLEAAEPLYLQAIELRETALGTGHYRVREALEELVKALRAAGRASDVAEVERRLAGTVADDTAN